MKRQWWVIVFLGVITCLAWLGSIHPILELIPNARSQIFVFTFLVFISFVLVKQIRPSIFAVVILLIHGMYLTPYVFANPDPLENNSIEIKAMQCNIYYNNKNIEAVADEIINSNSDVVAIHELLPEVWVNLKQRLEKEYPHSYAVPFDKDSGGQSSGGMAFLAKESLIPIKVDISYSPPDRVLLAAKTEVDGQTVTLVGLHPHASRFETRKVELRKNQLDGVVKLAEETDGPILVLADMNVTPTSPTYQNFINELGWRDPHRSTGWNTTWPTWGSAFGFPIDHIFASDHFLIHKAETNSGSGSDHRSLVVDLSIPS